MFIKKTTVNFHIDFYVHEYELWETVLGVKTRKVGEESVEKKGITAMNIFMDDRTKEELEIKLYLPAILINKKPKTYLDWASEINKLFLTEFLCAFVRVERDENGTPECERIRSERKLKGNIFDCPFVPFCDDLEL